MIITNQEHLEKIRKVKALADNGGTDGEKKAAWARLEVIIKKYGYSMADVEETLAVPTVNDFFNDIMEAVRRKAREAEAEKERKRREMFRAEFRCLDKFELALLSAIIKKYNANIEDKIVFHKVPGTRNYYQVDIVSSLQFTIEYEYNENKKRMKKEMRRAEKVFFENFLNDLKYRR